MADEAVLETVAEEVEDKIEGTEPTEETQGGEGGAAAAEESLSGAPLWKSIKDSFQGKDPKTVAQVRKAIYDSTEVGKRHPEGLKGIDAVLESVRKLSEDSETPDAVPIDQVIDGVLDERNFWRDFDSKFQSGDKAVVSQLREANPEAFQSLAPEVFNEYAALNPDGYSSIIAKAADGYFREQDLPLHFKLLDRIIPQQSDDPAVQQLIEGYTAIKRAFDGIAQMANKAVTSPEIKKQETQAQKQPNQEDAATRLRDIEWNAAIAPTSQSLMVTEAQKVLGGSKLMADEVAKVRTSFKEEINARVAINLPYQNALKAYLKANNKAQYTQRVQSEHKKIIQGAAKRIVSDVLDARKGKPAAQAAKPSQQAAKPAVDGAVKYERIAGAPQTLGMKVDLARTPQHMLVKQQAYIQGRKNPVTWSRK